MAISRRPIQAPLVHHHLQVQIKELLASYPSGLLASMFCSAFKRRFGEELDFKKLGFKTLVGFLQVIPTVNVVTMVSGEYRVFGLGTKSLNCISEGKWYAMENLENVMLSFVQTDYLRLIITEQTKSALPSY